MKKLMITIASVATAIGLHAADDPSGTSFTDWTAGEFTPTETESALWTVPAEHQSVIVADQYTFDAVTSAGRPAQFTDEAFEYSLKVATKLDAAQGLYRDSELTGPTYFDSLVKFTACENDTEGVTLDANSKLAVWLKEGATDTDIPHLMITAGYASDSDNVMVPTPYDCGEITKYDPNFVAGDTWVRLTIKAFNDVREGGGSFIPGFVVFVNAKAALSNDPRGSADSIISELSAAAQGWLDQGELFLSLKTGDAAAIASVGFAGQGSVDELSFTNVDPVDAAGAQFAKDTEYAYLAWQDGITGFEYTYNEKTETKSGLTGEGSLKIALVDGATTLDVENITYAEGKMGKSADQFELKSGETYTLTVSTIAATVEINGVKTPCASVSDAVAAINDAGTVDSATLTLAQDVEEGLAFENGGIGELIIDLAGKDITVENGWGIFASCPIEIINSTEDLGTVTAGDSADGAVASENVITIENGKFVGAVSSSDTYVNGGFFKPGPIEGAAIPENYRWTAEADEEGFFTIEEIPPAKATVIFIVNSGSPVSADFDVGSTINLNEEAANLITMADWQGFAGAWEKSGEYFTEFTVGTEGPYTFSNSLDIKLAKVDGAYQITSEDDLKTLAAAVADSYDTADKTFKQTVDITLTEAWEGIGTYQSATKFFAGTYDGNGNAINNVVMADNGTGANNYRGFFNQIDGGTVQNLTVETAGFGKTPPTGEYGCAAIAGAAYNATIANCTAQGAIDSATHNAGGIVIRIKDTTVKNCTNKADITGNYTKVAGIVVLNQNSTSACLIEGCVNKGTITASSNPEKAGKDGIAGIIAYVGDDKLTIKDCSNEGALIKGENANADAKIGQIVAYTYKTSKFDGTITGRADTLMFGDTTNDTGMNFATVDGSVATLVADTAVAEGNTYKVMSPLASFAYKFTAETAEISFLTGLNSAIAFTITDKNDKAVEPTEIEGGVKYAVSAGQVYPEDLPEDPAVKAKYDAWAAGKDISDPNAPEVMQAFLLNCALDQVEAEKTNFKVESIEFKNGEWVVTVAGQKLKGAEYGNGYVNIISVKEKFPGADGEKADFFQAVLQALPLAE